MSSTVDRYDPVSTIHCHYFLCANALSTNYWLSRQQASTPGGLKCRPTCGTGPTRDLLLIGPGNLDPAGQHDDARSTESRIPRDTIKVLRVAHQMRFAILHLT
jgi:hypothetical protein